MIKEKKKKRRRKKEEVKNKFMGVWWIKVSVRSSFIIVIHSLPLTVGAYKDIP